MSLGAWRFLRERVAVARRGSGVRFYGADIGLFRNMSLFRGLEIHSLNPFYRTTVDRMSFYRRVADMLIDRAFEQHLSVIYLSAGSPYIIDDMVRFMRSHCSDHGYPVTVISSMSFLDTVLAPVGGLNGVGLSIVHARAVAEDVCTLNPRLPTLLVQLVDWASEGLATVDLDELRTEFLGKLEKRLQIWYPPEHRVYVLQGSEQPDSFGRLIDVEIPLQALGSQRVPFWSNLFVPPVGVHWCKKCG